MQDFEIMAENLFDKYLVARDVKLLILLNLDENEIHLNLPAVDHEWKEVCNSTFNDDRFTHKFQQHVHRLMSLLSENDAHVCQTVYVQCPWDNLWTYGSVVVAKEDGLLVKVETKVFHPFTGHFEDKHQRLLFFPNLDKNDINDDNNDNDSDNLKTYFQDGYHHIAPVNTIDKYKKIKDKNFIHQLLNQENTGDYFRRPLVDIKPLISTYLVKKSDTAKWNPKSDQNGEIKDENGKDPNVDSKKNEKQENSGDTNYGDIYADFVEKVTKQFDYQFYEKFARRWLFEIEDKTQLCGIVDVQALNKFFPNWNNNNLETSNYIYQIPVLVDVTELLYGSYQSRPFETYLSQYDSIYQFGNNRYFRRVWIHPNDTHLIQPFATHSLKIYQHELLSTPVLASHPKLKAPNNKIDVKTYDFYDDSRLTLNEMFNQYSIRLTENTTADYPLLEKNNQLVFSGGACFELFKAAVIKRPSFENDEINDKYKFAISYEINEDNHESIVDYQTRLIYFDENKLDSIKLTNIFRINTIYKRPIINFDCESLIYQFTKTQKNLFSDEIKQMATSFYQTYAYDDNDDDDDDDSGGNDSKNKYTFEGHGHQTFLVHCKPLYICLFDDVVVSKKIDNKQETRSKTAWNFENWSNLIKEKYETVYTDCYTICLDEYKPGLLLMDPENIKSEQTFIEYLYSCTGHFYITIDITKEFDQFQNVLKKDWLAIQEKEKTGKTEKDWNSRKYFLKNMKVNKENGRVFWEHYLHLDDSVQVLPYYFE